MKTFYTLVTVLFFVVGTPWYSYVIVEDLSHPERWDRDFTHDPRIYLPLLAVVLPLCGLVWWRQVCKLRRMEKEAREWAQRFAADSDLRH